MSRCSLGQSRYPPNFLGWSILPAQVLLMADHSTSDRNRGQFFPNRPGNDRLRPSCHVRGRWSIPPVLRFLESTARSPVPRCRRTSQDQPVARLPRFGDGDSPTSRWARSRASPSASSRSMRPERAFPAVKSRPTSSSHRNPGYPPPGLARSARIQRRFLKAPIAHAPRNRDESRSGAPETPDRARPAPRLAWRIAGCASSPGQLPAQPDWIGGGSTARAPASRRSSLPAGVPRRCRCTRRRSAAARCHWAPCTAGWSCPSAGPPWSGPPSMRPAPAPGRPAPPPAPGRPVRAVWPVSSVQRPADGPIARAVSIGRSPRSPPSSPSPASRCADPPPSPPRSQCRSPEPSRPGV